MPGQPPRPLVVREIKGAEAKPAALRRGIPLPVRAVPPQAPGKRVARPIPFPAKRIATPAPPAGHGERDELQLSEMARRHLAYELKMLRETSAALRGKGIGPRSFRNAMLETFLVHYRNLLDFFYADQRRSLSHDVRASDFVADAKRWKARRPRLDKESSSYRERVNAQLAHLTYRRLKYNERNWPDRRMLQQIEALLATFAEQLPPRRRRWFQKALAAAQQAA
jgi:hypothetical protein